MDRSQARAALVVAVVASFLAPFMGSAITVALPAIGAEFHLGPIGLGWIATIYLITAAACLMPFGKWADLRGRKKVFCSGMGMYTLTSLLLALAPSGAILLELRALQGIGGAMIFGTGTAILMSVVPPAERGRALGINVASVYLGLALGPFAGGLLTHYLGWRSLFAVNVALGALALWVALVQLRADPPPARDLAFDWTGAVLYALACSGLMFGFARLSTLPGVLVSLGAAGFLAAFVWWEQRTPAPLVDLQLFRQSSVYAWSNAAALINYCATAAVTFLLSLYLQNVLHETAQATGVVLLVQPAVMALLSPLAGSLSDRLEPRLVASWGMGLTALGLLLLAVGTAGLSLVFIVLNLFLLGIGFALFSSPNTNAVMSAVDQRFYGEAAATLGTMRLTGQTLSMGLVMLIFALKMDPHPARAADLQLVASMRLAFVLFFLLCCAGIFASLARGKLRR